MSDDFLPVSKEKLAHDLAMAWLTREKKEFQSSQDFTLEYMKLIQSFERSVDEATRYDFNPDNDKDI